HLKRLGIFPASFRDIEPLVGKRSAHAAKHTPIDQIADRRFHHAPRGRRGKKHRLLCTEQRLEFWMNLAVKIFEVFAAMANQRTRKRGPGCFGNFNWTWNEKLVVRMHAATSSIAPAFAKLWRSRHRTPNAKSGAVVRLSPHAGRGLR